MPKFLLQTKIAFNIHISIYILFMHLDCKILWINSAPCCSTLTTDRNAKLHSASLGQLHLKCATAGNDWFWERYTRSHRIIHQKSVCSHHTTTWIADFWLKWHFVPATSNSTSSVTLLARAASRSSWLASSRVPSSVGIPLIERSLSPTCNSPHLECKNKYNMHSKKTRAHMYNNTRIYYQWL